MATKAKVSKKARGKSVKSTAKRVKRKVTVKKSGLVKKAKRVVGEVVKGALSGAATGALAGAVEAGRKQAGIKPAKAETEDTRVSSAVSKKKKGK